MPKKSSYIVPLRNPPTFRPVSNRSPSNNYLSAMPDVVGIAPKPSPRLKKKKVHTTTSALKLAAKKRSQIVDERPAWNTITNTRNQRDK